MKCPYCGSKRTQGTNIGKRAMASILGIGAGLAASFVNPGVAGGVMSSANKQLCEYADYICLDCKKEFSIKR
jgi:transposase-like protein